MPFQFQNWPNIEYYNHDHSILSIHDSGPNSRYYYAIQFWIKGGEAGYMGLQTDLLGNPDGNQPAPNLGKGVNYAIWGATNVRPGPNSGVSDNTDGEAGYRLFMPYEWQAGTVYRLRLWALKKENGGRWWGCWIRNVATCDEAWLGDIFYPSEEGLSDQSLVFTEYYGPGRMEDPAKNPEQKPICVAFLNCSRNNDDNNPGKEIRPVSTSLQQHSEPTTLILEPTNPAMTFVKMFHSD
jgi:hypothetical protein